MPLYINVIMKAIITSWNKKSQMLLTQNIKCNQKSQF